MLHSIYYKGLAVQDNAERLSAQCNSSFGQTSCEGNLCRQALCVPQAREAQCRVPEEALEALCPNGFWPATHPGKLQ